MVPRSSCCSIKRSWVNIPTSASLPLRRSHLHSSAAAAATTTTSGSKLYDPIESRSSFDNVLRTCPYPLITLWTTHYCSACKPAKARLWEFVSGAPEEIKVGLAEVRLGAPGVETLGANYNVYFVPTMLAFVEGENVERFRVSGGGLIGDKRWLDAWIRDVSKGGKVKGRRFWSMWF